MQTMNRGYLSPPPGQIQEVQHKSRFFVRVETLPLFTDIIKYGLIINIIVFTS